MMKLSSWGRLSRQPHTCIALNDRRGVADQLEQFRPGICFGMGRSYGDVCLNSEGISWQTRGLDRLIEFSADTGVLVCESGALLKEIQDLMVPRGWMLPVTPGTQLITIGGAIANDVHGKNHHVHGTFGEHVQELILQRSDGQLLRCSSTENADMFRATIGGLGLTGVILQASLKLRPVGSAWLDTDTQAYQSLPEFFELSQASEADWEHTVSWIDCLSGDTPRGIFLRANHREQAPPDQKSQPSRKKSGLAMPLVPPVSLVNRLSLRPFNAAYYVLNKRKEGAGIAHYQPFFYPLDAIGHWNRMYGPRGFYQYQCVVPEDSMHEAIGEMLRTIGHSGQGSFLAVLKTFGKRPAAGLLSFPMPGATLALDFPNQGQKTLSLFTRLDAIVSQAGGRLYAAKDARMPADMFQRAYPALSEFTNYRDPGISSDMSRRLMGS
jgi:FAD/FMN-containing dehydrogenase